MVLSYDFLSTLHSDLYLVLIGPEYICLDSLLDRQPENQHSCMDTTNVAEVAYLQNA